MLSPGINWFCFKSKLLYIAPEVTSLLEFLVTSSSIFIGVISPSSLKYTGVVSDPTDLGVTTLPWISWSFICKLTSQAVSLLSLRVISPVCSFIDPTVLIEIVLSIGSILTPFKSISSIIFLCALSSIPLSFAFSVLEKSFVDNPFPSSLSTLFSANSKRSEVDIIFLSSPTFAII